MADYPQYTVEYSGDNIPVPISTDGSHTFTLTTSLTNARIRVALTHNSTLDPFPQLRISLTEEPGE